MSRAGLVDLVAETERWIMHGHFKHSGLPDSHSHPHDDDSSDEEEKYKDLDEHGAARTLQRLRRRVAKEKDIVAQMVQQLRTECDTTRAKQSSGVRHSSQNIFCLSWLCVAGSLFSYFHLLNHQVELGVSGGAFPWTGAVCVQ